MRTLKTPEPYRKLDSRPCPGICEAACAPERSDITDMEKDGNSMGLTGLL